MMTERISDLDRAIGARIRERRIMAELSQRELSMRMGMHGQQLYNVENGRNCVTARQLWFAARALGCSVDNLMPEDTLLPTLAADERDARVMEMHLACAAVNDPRLQRALLKLAQAVVETQEAAA